MPDELNQPAQTTQPASSQPIQASPATPTPSNNLSSAQTPMSKKSEGKKKTYMLIAIVILIVIIMGGLAFVFGTNNSVTAPIKRIFIKTEVVPTPSDSMEKEDLTPTQEPEISKVREATSTPEPTDTPEVTDIPSLSPTATRVAP